MGCDDGDGGVKMVGGVLNNKVVRSRLSALVSNKLQCDYVINDIYLLIELQQRTLVQGDNHIVMNLAQGAIAVLRSMKTLRDVING